MARKPKADQLDIFEDFPPVDNTATVNTVKNIVTGENARHVLALRLSEKLDKDGEITAKFLTDEANRAFGGTQAQGVYSSKDAYDAMEAAFNIHLGNTEKSDWPNQNAAWARNKAEELTSRIQKLPTQTRRDGEMDEFQQFSTPPALSFVANWVAAVKPTDVMMEPSAGTGDLAIWSEIAGAEIILNELSERRQDLLAALFPKAKLFKENAEQLDNVLPTDTVPTVIVMNPPFSSTAGRVQGQRDTTNGARHIEQALKRLEDGGRLVGIVGKGMAADRPAFRKWWKGIEDKYTVRANIGISGKEYAKYGTSFDNQIIVIDKTGATNNPVITGNVNSVAELPMLLESIRNERHQLQPRTIEPESNGDIEETRDTIRPDNGIGGSGSDKGSIGSEPVGDGGDTGTDTTDSQPDEKPGIGNVIDDGIGTGDDIRDSSIGDVGGVSGGDTGGDSGINDSNVSVEAKTNEVTEFSDSVFSIYTPQRLTIQGSRQHPGKLVQSAAMSAVEPPAPTYAPVLPKSIIQDGLLSIAQLESIVYAGQAHSSQLPNGYRKGFFIGDGTGVGKGREISGIILDNMLRERNKAVWVSFNEGLIEDARRDFSGIGGDPGKIFFQGKTKAGNEITQRDGILFTTYSTLRGGEKKQANDQGQKGGKTRTQQIVEWLGKDFDGVIAFDEAHSMGNAIAIKGKRGVRKPSQQAIAGINLQRELPNARVVYVSATGATEISNLSYADRLGLWGEGTPFADVNSFIQNVSNGGIAAMELISRDMKAMGMYIARSLSFDGVTYERLDHTLSNLQEDIYNELAGAWQIVLNNVNEALEITQAGSSGSAKSAAMAQFWGAHQRFFNQVITAMQTPSVIDDIRQQIEAGNVAVIQLVNTNEAAQERIIADAAANANDIALEDLDFTPRQMLMDYVRNGFPVAAFEESKDENGNTIYVPVKDSEGNQVFDREAIALRDALLETLQQIRVPENPLDSIINSFGSDMVAEVTGRSRRFVQTRDEDGYLKVVEEKRGKNSSRADAEAFQNDKKKILVFSGAGGTGYSFHADNTAINRHKRIHYILQPGWRADAAVQGFGRTHRTNQAEEPHYVLPTTNLKAQKRFVSSIARRLDQLGALTRGQRQATSQGMFTAADNLESQYAKTGLYNFFVDLYRGKTDLNFNNVTRQMGLNLLDDNGALSESKFPDIPQFLNRLLSLKTDQQNAVFDEFEKRLVEAVEYAKQQGTYDEGLQTLKALSIKKTRDELAYQNQETGAQTRYVELAVTNSIEYNSWSDIKKITKKDNGELSGWFVSEYGKNKGDVFFLADIGQRLGSEGENVRRGVIHRTRNNDHKYIDNADVIHRGWDYRNVDGKYQKITLTRAIDESEAEKLWNAQIEAAPKTETKTERMLVGVILPIWDRVEGSETIYRLQTDEGEQLLGRMLGIKSAKQTLKNLGLDSSLSNMSDGDLFDSIKNGSKAILSNGWEIASSKVNHEDRIEVKGRSYLTEAEKRVLKEQGAFIERINWVERVFIPTGENGVDVFARITASKPVVDLIEKGRSNEMQAYGLPQVNAAANDDNLAVGGESKSDDFVNQGVTSMEQMEKKPFHQQVADKIIEQLEKGTAPWQKPWDSGTNDSSLPFNPTTGKRYKGINAVYLSAQGHSDQRWMTYKQATNVGAQVRKGEKGTPVQYWKYSEEQDKVDESGKPVLDENGKPVKESVKLERPRVFYATVFNAEQIDGLPPIQRKDQSWDAIERAENILKASGASIHHGHDQAFYRPGTDSIHLPDKSQFQEASAYYATALHELGHWTGHRSRLGRDLAHPFGSEGYAKEELRAEIASMIVGNEVGIGHDPGQHAAYVGSWIKALKEDSMEIYRASSDAEKIYEFVLAFEQKQQQEQVASQSQIQTQTLEDNQSIQQMREPQPADSNASDLVAESWTLAQMERGTLIRALDSANPKQIDRAISVVNDMQPLNTQNPFWSRHQLPFNVDELDSKIQQATEYLDQRQLDARVSEARKEGDLQALDAAANEALGFTLPHDWNGRIQVQGNVNAEIDGQRREVPTASLGVEPEYWSVYAQHEDKHQKLADFDTEQEADELAERLALIDAHSETNEREKAAKLARIQEERVRRDPHSTPEDVSAAKEARKAAEAAAFVNEADLRHKRDEQERQADQVGQAGQATQNPPERIYIDVPFSQKEEAKALGARWDRQEKSWYVPTSIDPLPFAKWERTEAAATEASPKAEDSIPTRQERQYLAVPYGERQAAKDHGALWDKAAKSWYAGPNADIEKLQRWKPENVPGDQGPALSPREEFAEALRSIGADVSGEHPIMDGQKHRIGVDGDKKGEQAGFYVGHLDGHPAGYMKNNRTGVEMRWKSKGYALDPEQKAKLQAEAAAKLESRAIEQERMHEQTAQRIGKQMEDLTPATTPTAYMQAKGIIPQAGAFTDREGQKTYIPATDAEGKLWTMQYINEEGTKRFAKDSRKEGTFHVVGGLDALAQAPALVIGEGYATASSLSQSLGFATVAAFDSGNLPHVAKALHEKFPDKPVIIAGDNDKHLELSQGINPGRIKAEEAAKAVGGKAIFPIFAPGENVCPAHLEPITPQSYRKHEQASRLLETAEKEPDKLTVQQATALKRDLLSDAQLAAYNKIKAHTDFNDLATKSVLGKEAIERQVGAAVGKSQGDVRQLTNNKQEQNKLELNKYRKLDKPEHQTRRSARIG